MLHLKIFIGASKKNNKMKRTHIILTQILVTSIILSCGNDSTKMEDEQDMVQDTLTTEDFSQELEQIIAIEYDKDSLKNCIDSIWNCQKVATKNEDWRETSNGEMGLSMMQIDAEDRIYLDFGENNDLRFVNYWTFIVEPNKGYRISFYDALADENIDFSDWCE